MTLIILCNRLSLESERQRYKIEKDEFSAKLRRIESEMTEQGCILVLSRKLM